MVRPCSVHGMLWKAGENFKHMHFWNRISRPSFELDAVSRDSHLLGLATQCVDVANMFNRSTVKDCVCVVQLLEHPLISGLPHALKPVTMRWHIDGNMFTWFTSSSGVCEFRRHSNEYLLIVIRLDGSNLIHMRSDCLHLYTYSTFSIVVSRV